MRALICIALLTLGCSDKPENNHANNGTSNLDDAGVVVDQGQSPDVGDGSDSGVADVGMSDMQTLLDAGAGDVGDPSDSGTTDMESADAGVDIGADGGADMSGPGGYDTTGWDMKRFTISESASTGTPDSYFFDVDAGSPLSASIVGGGGGSWSVNVFGGYSNHLYCTGLSSCQVMLRPEDVTVIVTAITTDIGSYTLTVDYAGDGLQ